MFSFGQKKIKWDGQKAVYEGILQRSPVFPPALPVTSASSSESGDV